MQASPAAASSAQQTSTPVRPAPADGLGEAGQRAVAGAVAGGDELGGPVDRARRAGGRGRPGGGRTGRSARRSRRRPTTCRAAWPVRPMVTNGSPACCSRVTRSSSSRISIRITPSTRRPVTIRSNDRSWSPPDGRQQHVEVGAGGRLDDAGDEAQLHVGQPLARRRDDQAEGAGAPLLERAGAGVRAVVQLVDDRLDPPPGRLRHACACR